MPAPASISGNDFFHAVNKAALARDRGLGAGASPSRPILFEYGGMAHQLAVLGTKA